MKRSKLIIGICAGATLAAVIGILIYKNSKSRQTIGEVKSDEHPKSDAKNHLRRTMNKANHIKHEHRNSFS
jgi:hypothetical protein